MLGSTISHYRITEKLGEGGMGEVYLAEDIRLGHQVAIKILSRHLTHDADHRRRLEREAKAVANLHHPYIVSLHEYDEIENELYLVTEYLPGGSLRGVLRENPDGVPVENVLRWGVQAAEGLAEAHEQGILHRDIKPDNLLLTQKGDLCIADFGLARLDTATAITQAGTVMGTLGYMAPEQVRGEQAGAGADLFALGATLYELITGQSPFLSDTKAGVLHAILNREPDPVTASRPEVPEELSELVQQLLQKDSTRRTQSAEEVAAQLRRIANDCDLGATMPMVVVGAKSHRRRRIAAGICIVVLAALALGMWYVRRPAPESITPDSSTRIVVLPFTVRGGEDWLREGMAQLLSSKLDGAGAVQTVDAHAMLAQLRSREEDSLDPEAASEVAEQLQAGLFILGNVMQAGDRVHVDASMYDLLGTTDPLARAEAEGHVEDLLGLADLLSIDLLKEHMGGELRGSIDRESISTKSYAALKAFLQGEQLWRQQRATDSTPLYEKAVTEDPEFALAWLRLSMVSGWKPSNIKGEETNRARREALDRALALRDKLSPRHQLWLDAYAEGVFEEYDRSVQLFTELLSRFPDDVEAWDRLGTIKVIYNAWRHGESVLIGKRDLERALELDPEFRHARFHMTSVNMVEKDGDLDGDDPFAVFARDDRQAQVDLYQQGKEGPDTYLMWTEGFAIFSKNFEGAEWTTGLRVDPERHPETRGVGYIILAMLAAAQGEWERARGQFDAADDLMPDLSLQYRALLAGHPFLAVSTDEVREIRDAVAVWDPAGVPEPESEWPHARVHQKIRPQLKEYLQGLLSVRLGELDRARRHADELVSMGEGPREQRLARDQSHSIHAQCLWQEHRFDEALARFEAAEIKAGYEEYQFSLFFFQSLDRYLRAELLLEMGREEEALRWFGSFAWIISQEFLYQPHSNLRRAQILDRKGDNEQAIKRYQRFLENWENSDAHLRPLFEEAKARLSELQS